MRNRVKATVYVSPFLWERAQRYAGEAGHDVARDVVGSALLEYVKVQAEVRGETVGRCSACNATTIDRVCLDHRLRGCSS